jgi:hypothetical protein
VEYIFSVPQERLIFPSRIEAGLPIKVIKADRN